jgi:hypothetical protein
METPPQKTVNLPQGINDAGNGNGLLSATVTGGLPAGNYRVCSMTSSSNHQPMLMPVAQRGAQDEFQKFTVGAAASGNGNGNTNANAGGNAATSATKAAAKATTTARKSKATKRARAYIV